MKSKKFLEDLRKLVIDTDGGKERQARFMEAFKQKVYEIIVEEEKRRLQRVLS